MKTQVVTFLQLLFVRAAIGCSCVQELASVKKDLDDLQGKVAFLGKKVTPSVRLEHNVLKLSYEIKNLDAEINALKNRDQNAASSLIKVSASNTMEDVVNKVAEHGKRLKRLAVDVDVVGATLEAVNSTLSSSLGMVRSELKHNHGMLHQLSHVPERLEKLEDLLEVGSSVLEFLDTSPASDDTAVPGNVTQIEFLSAEGNLVVNISDTGEILCADHANVSDSVFPESCVVRGNLSADTNRAKSRGMRTSRSDNRAPLQRVLKTLASRFVQIERNVENLNLPTRLRALEDLSERLDGELDTWKEQSGVNYTRTLNIIEMLERELQTVANQTKYQEQSTSADDKVIYEEKLRDLMADLADSRRQIQDAISQVEQVQASTALTAAELADTTEEWDAFAATITDVERRVSKLNQTVAAQVESISKVVDEKAERLEGTINKETSALNTSLVGLFAYLNDSLEVHVETLTSSMAAFDADKQRLFQLSDSLMNLIRTLNTSLSDKVRVLNNSLADLADNQLSDTGLYGWHPNDSLPCPGLLFLGWDNNLVLTTENGTFRSPDLPSEPLPAGTRVHFRCSHPGMYRLDGSRSIRCAAGRWSSRPPSCYALATLEELKASNLTDGAPSISFGSPGEPEYHTDDHGTLVIPPGAPLKLNCLYPRTRGSVSWLHNGTLPVDAVSSWTARNNTDYGFQLAIGNVTTSHSGTYACVGPGGSGHEIRVKVKTVSCEAVNPPSNGELESSATGTAPVGSTARFTCHVGYKLDGQEELTCLGSGRWSAPFPSCVKIDDFSPPAGACRSPPKSDTLDILPMRKWYLSGDKIRYQCKDNKMLVGKATSTCLEGIWIGGSPSCL